MYKVLIKRIPTYDKNITECIRDRHRYILFYRYILHDMFDNNFKLVRKDFKSIERNNRGIPKNTHGIPHMSRDPVPSPLLFSSWRRP